MMNRGGIAFIGFTTFFFLFVVFFRSHVPAAMAEERNYKDVEQVVLKIDRMECESCVKNIRKALLRVPGVISADVRFKEGQAIVAHEKGMVTEEQLVKAVESASDAMYTYTASVMARN